MRPSRLLLNGLAGEALARRMWHLAGPPRGRAAAAACAKAPASAPRRSAPIPALPPISVTAFRDYLESPRQFFYLRVLGLRTRAIRRWNSIPAASVALSTRCSPASARNRPLRDSADPRSRSKPSSRTEFQRLVRARFGKWMQPAVEVQLEEIARRLRGFAPVQARLRREGWAIRYVEGDGSK